MFLFMNYEDLGKSTIPAIARTEQFWLKHGLFV